MISAPLFNQYVHQTGRFFHGPGPLLFKYFSKYHFPGGGYNLKWFKIKIGPVYIPLPNTKDRISAVKIHDIHHIITEYEANLKGEAEFAGWEIASGCGKYYMAWILNFASFFYGVFFFPRALFRAFMRGRNASTNFYQTTPYESLLNKSVGELRQITAIDQKRNNSVLDYMLFAGCCLLVIGIPVFCSIGAIRG